MVDDGRTDDGRTTDGRTTEHGYTISSPCEPDGSGELKKPISCPSMYYTFHSWLDFGGFDYCNFQMFTRT